MRPQGRTLFLFHHGWVCVKTHLPFLFLLGCIVVGFALFHHLGEPFHHCRVVVSKEGTGFGMILCLSLQLLIAFFRHRLAPLVRGAFAGHFHCQMREPAIGCSTVSVLDLRGNVHHIARMQLLRRFAPFLIVAPACHADKDLPTALCGMVDVPVVPAARFKGDVVNANLCGGQGAR